MNETTEDVLIIFIKNPELGKVKTRLAASIGEEKALEVYKSLLQHTRKVSSAIDAKRLLFYSEKISASDDWPNAFYQKKLQVSGNLGDRMKSAFSAGFEVGQRVMIIGSDCPQLNTEIVQKGFRALRENDFVIGPAFDGGYYLLGMNNYSPQLFENMPWSTAEVADITRSRIASLDGSLYELPALSDVDFEEDWKKYGWEL